MWPETLPIVAGVRAYGDSGVAELTLQSTKHTLLALVILGSALGGQAASAEPTAPGGYPQTRHAPANFALLLEPAGWQEPVVTTAAEVPAKIAQTPASPSAPSAAFPLETYDASGRIVDGAIREDATGGGACADCGPGGPGGNGTTYINGPLYDPSCAPHDPMQPRCAWTDDFMWGCGGSPFRHGPGRCDTWRVGPVWDVSVDGMVMHRDGADLAGIIDATDLTSFGAQQTPDFSNDFEYGPGGRLSITGKVPRWVGYRVHVGYEGIEEWNSSVIYPKFFYDPAGAVPPVIENPFASEQRRVHYRSSLHSAEINFVRCYDTSDWQPYCGVRYIKFDDELRDFINQEAQAPLPGLGPDPISVTTTDQLNLFDLENNLIGFQVGVRRDLWNIGPRISLQGFVNGGVYHNEIKRTNLMSFTTVEQFADLTDQVGDQGRVDVRQTANNEVTEIADIAYAAEASLTAVCRLNRCCALRAGYQVLWIDGLRLAEDAFLPGSVYPPGDDISRDLLFYGWHAGFEYRR